MSTNCIGRTARPPALGTAPVLDVQVVVALGVPPRSGVAADHPPAEARQGRYDGPGGRPHNRDGERPGRDGESHEDDRGEAGQHDVTQPAEAGRDRAPHVARRSEGRPPDQASHDRWGRSGRHQDFFVRHRRRAPPDLPRSAPGACHDGSVTGHQREQMPWAWGRARPASQDTSVVAAPGWPPRTWCSTSARHPATHGVLRLQAHAGR